MRRGDGEDPPSGAPHLFVSLAPLMFTHMTQGLQTTLPYTLGVYMVRDFLAAGAADGGAAAGLPPDEARVGQLTGLLGAVFCAAQLVTSYPLGRLSDVIGRKPIIVVGNISCVLSVVLFGLSGSYLQASTARALGGAFNAIIGAEKSMIGETLTPELQAKAMGYISLCWGVGTMIGPLLGGMLAQPCAPGGVLQANSGACHPGSLLSSSPYLLPCLAAALFSAVATVLSAVAMRESLPRRGGGPSLAPYRAVPQDDDAGEVELSRQGVHARDKLSPHPEDSAAQLHTVDLHLDVEPALGKVEPAKTLSTPWHQQSSVRRCLGGYGLIAFVYILLDELTPIFASAPLASGGLGYPTSSLAGPLSFGGAVLIAWALWGFPWLHRRLGTVKLCVQGLWTTIPMALLIPAASLMTPSQPMMWLAMGMKAVAGVNTFTAAVISVNAASPVGDLGAVNGVGQMLASAARALGPALGGVAWAASLSLFAALGWPPWGHQILPFACAAAVAAATTLIYRGGRVKLPEDEVKIVGV